MRREVKHPDAKRQKKEVKELVDCHGATRDGKACKYHGKTRPTGAVFFYCGFHQAKWRTYER